MICTVRPQGIMLKFTAKDKEQLTELKQGWPCILVFIVLLSSHEVVGRWFGRGWAVLSSAFALAVWFILRPWNWGLLPRHLRSQTRLLGTMILGGWIFLTLLFYWRRRG